MGWFLGVLGFSVAIAFIGWKKSPKKREAEPDKPLFSREYQRIYEGCIAYVEQLYQQKK